jgi:hypothetical protein
VLFSEGRPSGDNLTRSNGLRVTLSSLLGLEDDPPTELATPATVNVGRIAIIDPAAFLLPLLDSPNLTVLARRLIVTLERINQHYHLRT